MIFKERPHSFQKGYPNDLLYRSRSGISNNQLTYWTEAKAQSEYQADMLLRSTLATGSSYVGMERFVSTQYKRPKFNYCYHHTNGAYSFPYGVWFQKVTNAYRQFNPYWRQTFPSTAKLWYKQYDVVQPDDGFRARAFWSMRPRFESGVQLLNFIFELKDFRDIAKHLLRIEHTADLFEKAFRGKRFPDPSVPAAQAHLLYSFAIQPLMRDIPAIMAALLHQVQDKQKEFGFLGEMRQKSHYTECIFEDLSEITDRSHTADNYTFSDGMARRVVATATMEYKYSYKPYSAAEAFLRYWGLTGSAEAFWNMIPFSFVVDYFLTIGASLKIMRSDPHVDLSVRQYCESTVDTRTSGIHTNLGYKSPIFIINGKYFPAGTAIARFLTGYMETVYERKIREPYKGPALPKLKLPSKAQGLNLLALARCFV